MQRESKNKFWLTLVGNQFLNKDLQGKESSGQNSFRVPLKKAKLVARPPNVKTNKSLRILPVRRVELDDENTSNFIMKLKSIKLNQVANDGSTNQMSALKRF
mmetsp:Transcript_10910/g.18241  ORF Transcript_10910/g.18241 Transcript_10910/m.18241 type:complete len:102 (-) Transcript_10910:50-355(-)